MIIPLLEHFHINLLSNHTFDIESSVRGDSNFWFLHDAHTSLKENTISQLFT